MELLTSSGHMACGAVGRSFRRSRDPGGARRLKPLETLLVVCPLVSTGLKALPPPWGRKSRARRHEGVPGCGGPALWQWTTTADFTDHAHAASLCVVAFNNRFVATGSKDEAVCIYDMKVEHSTLLHHNVKESEYPKKKSLQTEQRSTARRTEKHREAQRGAQRGGNSQINKIRTV